MILRGTAIAGFFPSFIAHGVGTRKTPEEKVWQEIFIVFL